MCDPIDKLLERLFQWFYDELDKETRNLLWEKCQHFRREFFKANCGSPVNRISFAVNLFWFVYKVFHNEPVKFYRIKELGDKITRKIVDYDYIRHKYPRGRKKLKGKERARSRYFHISRHKKLDWNAYLVYERSPSFHYVDEMIREIDFISLSYALPSNKKYKTEFRRILSSKERFLIRNNDDRKKKLATDYAKTHTYDETGEKFNISISTIRAWMRQYGIVKRRR